MITGWWFQPSEKNDGVRQWVSDDIPYEIYEMENKRCLKPPTNSVS